MKYKLKKIALITEIIGGIAIVISLLFVGLQFKENAKATKSATALAAVSELTSWYRDTGNSKQGSNVFWNYMSNPDSLKPEERFQAIMSIHSAMLAFQNSYYLVKEGTLDAEVHESLIEIINGIKKSPGFIEFWKIRKSIFRKDFQEYVDEIIRSDKINSKGLYEIPVDK
tara:strand:+ start:292 stop:801 length:510 start_codon:yes stop_codon:yes gene_type:complete